MRTALGERAATILGDGEAANRSRGRLVTPVAAMDFTVHAGGRFKSAGGTPS